MWRLAINHPSRMMEMISCIRVVKIIRILRICNFCVRSSVQRACRNIAACSTATPRRSLVSFARTRRPQTLARSPCGCVYRLSPAAKIAPPLLLLSSKTNHSFGGGYTSFSANDSGGLVAFENKFLVARTFSFFDDLECF